MWQHICPRCSVKKKDDYDFNTGNRFSSPLAQYEGECVEEIYTGKIVSVESEDYRIHYDTHVCFDCGYWDWFNGVWVD